MLLVLPRHRGHGGEIFGSVPRGVMSHPLLDSSRSISRSCHLTTPCCRLGITSFGHRHYLLKCLAALKAPGQIEGASRGVGSVNNPYCLPLHSADGPCGHAFCCPRCCWFFFRSKTESSAHSLPNADPSASGMSMLPPPPRRGQNFGATAPDVSSGWSSSSTKAWDKRNLQASNLSFRDDTMGPTITRAGTPYDFLVAPVAPTRCVARQNCLNLVRQYDATRERK
jgi:hypothetical protein